MARIGDDGMYQAVLAAFLPEEKELVEGSCLEYDFLSNAAGAAYRRKRT